MSEHVVADHTYSIGRLNVRQQAEVATRLGFMVMALEREVEADHVDGARFIGTIINDDWKSLPQADRDTIMAVCLGVVRVERAGRMHPAFNAQTGEPQFEDMGIDLNVMLELLDLSIQENLGPFFEKLRGERKRRLDALQNMNGQDSSQ